MGTVDAKSLLGVLPLDIKCGSCVMLVAEGYDEEEATLALGALLAK